MTGKWSKRRPPRGFRVRGPGKVTTRTRPPGDRGRERCASICGNSISAKVRDSTKRCTQRLRQIPSGTARLLWDTRSDSCWESTYSRRTLTGW